VGHLRTPDRRIEAGPGGYEQAPPGDDVKPCNAALLVLLPLGSVAAERHVADMTP